MPYTLATDKKRNHLMRYFRHLAFVGALAAAFAFLPLSGCGQSQAEKTPNEIPPPPTGIAPSGAPGPAQPAQNPNQP